MGVQRKQQNKNGNSKDLYNRQLVGSGNKNQQGIEGVNHGCGSFYGGNDLGSNRGCYSYVFLHEVMRWVY